MKIKTKRLVLVPLGPEFLETTHRYASDYENTNFMVYLPNENINETKDFLEQVHAEWQKSKPLSYEFAILLENEHIGAISLSIKDDITEGVLGWIIRKEFWGNGYATEAARELIKFAKQNLELHTIIAHCDSENVASYKVMEKLGMSLVSRTSGRRNKFSDSDREELMYRLILQ